MILRGMQLHHVRERFIRESDLLDGVDALKVWVAQQAEAGKSEDGMKDVHHVSWPVREPAHLRILKASVMSKQHRGGRKLT